MYIYINLIGISSTKEIDMLDILMTLLFLHMMKMSERMIYQIFILILPICPYL